MERLEPAKSPITSEANEFSIRELQKTNSDLQNKVAHNEQLLAANRGLFERLDSSQRAQDAELFDMEGRLSGLEARQWDGVVNRKKVR
jgi:hypothetical protein